MRHDSGICEDCGMQFGDPNMPAALKGSDAYTASLALEWDGVSFDLLEASRWRVAREALEQGVEFMEVGPGVRYIVEGVEGLIGLEAFEAMLGLERYIEVSACD